MQDGKKAAEPITLMMGKGGLTPGFIAEAKDQLERSKIVRIRLPRGMSPDDRKKLAEDIVRETGSILVDRRGNTVILRDAGGRA